jgi:hypothetical protein
VKQILKEWRELIKETEDSGLDDTGADTGVEDGSAAEDDSFKMPVHLDWAIWKRFAVLPIDEVNKIDNELLNGETVDERFNEFRGDRWELKSLNRYVFGSPQQHQYSGYGFERHPELNMNMLPPSWTIAMSVMIEKADAVRFEFDSMVEVSDAEGLIRLAASHQYIGSRSNRNKGALELFDLLKKMEAEDPSLF